MTIYIIFLIVLLASSTIFYNYKINRKYNWLLFKIIIVIIMIFSGLRSSLVGNDTSKYLELYKEISNYDISLFTNRYEIGFVVLNKFLGMHFNNPQAIIIVSSLLIWSLVYVFFKNNSDNPFISTYILFTYGFFAFFVSGIRESIAIAICLFGFKFVKQRKLVKFLLTVMIATLFHLSACLYIPIYWIYNININRKNRTKILVITMIISIFFSKILNLVLTVLPKYGYYLNSDYNNGQIRLATILNILVVMLIYYISVIYVKTEKDEYQKNKGYLNSVFLGLVILLISTQFNLLDRVANYYTVFITIVIPNVLIRNKTKAKSMISLLILVSFLAYFVCIQLIRPEWNSIYPYSFF